MSGLTTILVFPDGSLFNRVWEESGSMFACKKKHCNHHSESSKKGGASARRRTGLSPVGESALEDDYGFTVAIPMAGGTLCSPFESWEQFAVLSVEDGEIQGREMLSPPFRETEILPRWLDNLGVGIIIAGTVSRRTLDLFARRRIDVLTGAPDCPPEDLVQQYLTGTLVTREITHDDPVRNGRGDTSDGDTSK